MATYGRRVLDSAIGHPIQVQAGGDPVWHPIGITIDWSVVVAPVADVDDIVGGTVIPAGQKYLRHGQVLVKDGDKWIPYVTHTMVRGEVVILNTTVLENGSVPGLTSPASDHPGALEGGLLWKDRVLANDSAASLAAGPLFSALETALPLVRWVG